MGKSVEEIVIERECSKFLESANRCWQPGEVCIVEVQYCKVRDCPKLQEITIKSQCGICDEIKFWM